MNMINLKLNLSLLNWHMAMPHPEDAKWLCAVDACLDDLESARNPLTTEIERRVKWEKWAANLDLMLLNGYGQIDCRVYQTLELTNDGGIVGLHIPCEAGTLSIIGDMDSANKDLKQDAEKLFFETSLRLPGLATLKVF